MSEPIKRDLEDLDFLCAVQQGFPVDPQYQARMEQLEKRGLISQIKSWELTEKGTAIIREWRKPK